MAPLDDDLECRHSVHMSTHTHTLTRTHPCIISPSADDASGRDLTAKMTSAMLAAKEGRMEQLKVRCSDIGICSTFVLLCDCSVSLCLSCVWACVCGQVDEQMNVSE